MPVRKTLLRIIESDETKVSHLLHRYLRSLVKYFIRFCRQSGGGNGEDGNMDTMWYEAVEKSNEAQHFYQYRWTVYTRKRRHLLTLSCSTHNPPSSSSPQGKKRQQRRRSGTTTTIATPYLFVSGPEKGIRLWDQYMWDVRPNDPDSVLVVHKDGVGQEPDDMIDVDDPPLPFWEGEEEEWWW